MSRISNLQNESETIKALKIELEIANAKNVHLAEENALLRHKLIRQTNAQLTTSNVNIDTQRKLFSLEEERDKMYEHLERLKAKYNKLHTAFLEKVKRCKTLEEVFARQKLLPGLVKKFAANAANENIDRQQQLQDENIINSNKIATLQRSLDEAYDIIDELEFELESVDFLEMENERLKNENNKLKKKDANNTTTTTPMANNDYINSNRRNEDHQLVLGHEKSLTCPGDEFVDNCGPDADTLPDLETIERSIQTQSLNDSMQAESHLLRRELLRSRLQNTKPPQRRTTGLQQQKPQSEPQSEPGSSPPQPPPPPPSSQPQKEEINSLVEEYKQSKFYISEK